MNDKVMYWGSTILGGVALVLILSNVFIINGNRAMQAELAQRQATINDGANWGQLNQALVQALAQASVENDDKDIRELLSSQGIQITKNDKADKADRAEKSEDKSEKAKK